MRCRSCDAEMAEDSAFCPRCGAWQVGGAGLETVQRMVEDYRRRLDQQPEDADARFNLALAYKHLGLGDLALAELERLRSQGEDFADLEYELAWQYWRSGRWDDAEAALQRAIALEPGHGAARELLRRLEQERGQQ